MKKELHSDHIFEEKNVRKSNCTDGMNKSVVFRELVWKIFFFVLLFFVFVVRKLLDQPSSLFASKAFRLLFTLILVLATFAILIDQKLNHLIPQRYFN